MKTAFPLSKPLFVAMLHCIWAHDVMRGVLSAYATAWLLVFEFMASSILDFKDEEEDARAGVLHVDRLRRRRGRAPYAARLVWTGARTLRRRALRRRRARRGRHL